MESDQQQQKGLFTFYREQADFEDELRSKKRLLKETRLEKIDQSEKKSSAHGHKKHAHNMQKKNAHSLFSQHQESESGERPPHDAKQRSAEAKDKLISILRKYNAKQLKRKDMRVIMEMDDDSPPGQADQLKSRLEKLLVDEESGCFKLVQQERIMNQQMEKKDGFTRKREEHQRINPFQRLAVIPTSFTSELEEQKEAKVPLKKVPSPPKSLIYSLEVRRNDRVEANIQQKDRYGCKEMPTSQPLRLNLPKIDSRSNSQLSNKSKMRPGRLGEKYYFEPLRSQSFRNKSQLSIYLESIKQANEASQPRPLLNKIHSLFIEQKHQKLKQQATLGGQEIRLGDIVRRMNFL